MKKLFYLGFALVLAAGVGCAITDYPIITDNDQGLGDGGGIVNTNGKAHLITSQVATLWPDGADELFSQVDQKVNGDQTITTYNNYSTMYPIFHDDLYCNPDWQGCAIVTAPNPAVGDADPFDYSWNQSCGGSRSLSLLVSYGARSYGECGRAAWTYAQKLQVLNAMNQAADGTLFGTINATNFSMVLSGANGSVNVPVISSANYRLLQGRKLLVDTNATLGSNLTAFANAAKQASNDGRVTLSVSLYGVTRDFNMKIRDEAVRNNSRRY